MFKFITRKSFFINLLVAGLLVILIIFIVFKSLGSITRHDENIRVPLVTGKVLSGAESQLKSQGFDVQVQDSVYIDSLAPLTVIKQSPESEELVKINRTVYLTVNRAIPPMIEMPDLRGFSFRSAQMYLESIGLKLGSISYTPDIARNAVKEQRFNGKTLNPGTKVPMSSTIDFILGSGLGETEMDVPNIVGLTVDQARSYLSSESLNLGVILVNGSVSDTASAFIVQQNPVEKSVSAETGDQAPNQIRAGQYIDVWISSEPPPPPTDSTSLPQ